MVVVEVVRGVVKAAVVAEAVRPVVATDADINPTWIGRSIIRKIKSRKKKKFSKIAGCAPFLTKYSRASVTASHLALIFFLI